MNQRTSDERFERFLDAVVDQLSDEITPSVRALMKSIRARYKALREQNQEGVTAEYLVTDLVGILSDFEVRIRRLERRADHDTAGS